MLICGTKSNLIISATFDREPEPLRQSPGKNNKNFVFVIFFWLLFWYTYNVLNRQQWFFDAFHHKVEIIYLWVWLSDVRVNVFANNWQERIPLPIAILFFSCSINFYQFEGKYWTLSKSNSQKIIITLLLEAYTGEFCISSIA